MQKVHGLNPPLLGISRNQPFSVKKGSQFTFTIHVTNHGESTASNVVVGMQIPWRTTFSSTDNGEIDAMTGGVVSPSGNSTPYTVDRQRDAGQIKGTGGGPDIISWHFASLPPQSSLKINLTVQCGSQFSDEAIQDNSAYVFADNVGVNHIAADPLTVWIFDKDLNDTKIQAVQTYFQNSGITVTPALDPAIALLAQTLTPQSQVQAFARLDALQLVTAGVKVIPLGKGQVLLIGQDGSGIVSQGAGNLVGHDGSSLVIQGDASKISVNTGVAAVGTQTAEYLLNNIPSIVSQGAGNVIQGGGGNLISKTGDGILSNEPGGGILGPISTVANNLYSADGGRIVAQGAGNVVAAGAGNLIGQDGGSLIGQDGGSLIGQDGGGLVQMSSGIVSQGAGNIVSQGAGNIVSQGAGNLIPPEGR
jgi:uncharacterized repeat protein (TIGR01451 family)